jgi:acyl dehydratase
MLRNVEPLRHGRARRPARGCGVLHLVLAVRSPVALARQFHEAMLTITRAEELRARVGEVLGTSAWHEVTQARIQAFADATEDWEPLHVDPERAKATPWGVTIAHGLYTLSLGPKFQYEIFEMTGHSLALNYGYEKVRWLNPVKVGSRVRMRQELLSAEPIEGGTKFVTRQTFEIEGEEKPACVAESIFAYFD